MDAVFGRATFRANIVWRIQSANSYGRGFGRIVDRPAVLSTAGVCLERYRYMSLVRSAAKPISDSRFQWSLQFRSQDLTAKYSEAGGRRFNWRGAVPRAGNGWRYTREDLETLYAEGRIILRKDGAPTTGPAILCISTKTSTPEPSCTIVWTDIAPVCSTASKERLPVILPRNPSRY